MTGNNSLAADLDVAENMKLDAAFKSILAYKEILARILRGCVTEYKGLTAEEIIPFIEDNIEIGTVGVHPNTSNSSPKIHGDSTEDTSVNEGAVKYDIKFRAALPDESGKVCVIVNVEGQMNYKPGYPLESRGVYYCARLLSSQYGREFTHSHYEKLKKVYSIWICFSPPADSRNTISTYRITKEDVYGSVEDTEAYDLMTMVIARLGKRPGKSGNEMLEMLNTIFTSEYTSAEKKSALSKQFGISMTEPIEEVLSDMDNISTAIRAESRAEGWKEGRVEGRAEGRCESAIIVAKNTGMPLEEALKMLGVTKAEWNEYLKTCKQ